MTSQPAQVPGFQPPLPNQFKLDGQSCPACGQEIPTEKLEEISGKIALRDREQARAIAARLEQQYKAEKAHAIAEVQAELDSERRASAAREAEVRTVAEALVQEKAAEAERARQQLNAEWQTRFDGLDAARKTAEELIPSLQAQILQIRQSSVAALESAKAEAQARETEIWATARQTAESAVAERVAAIEAARVQSETALEQQLKDAESSKIAAEQKGIELAQQVTRMQTENDAQLAKLKEDTAADAARIHKEATEAAESRVSEKLIANQKAIEAANDKALEAEKKLMSATEQHSKALTDSLNAQREVMEKAKEDALNLERASSFEETQRLSTKVNELQRALEKKTNEELGEGAEIDLFEALKNEFPEDRINRIPKGAPGADIKHVIMSRGCECGTILYDSKNHHQFRSEHVAKLKVDQLAAKAEHAILSTHKFPQSKAQIHMQDGVLLAKPARVLILATLIRQHVLQLHRLRVSAIERQNKTIALYEFITSERCTQLLGRVDSSADDLLKQQETEMRWHQNNWKKQGTSIRAIQKAKADLDNEISGIIGAAAVGTAPDEAV